MKFYNSALVMLMRMENFNLTMMSGIIVMSVCKEGGETMDEVKGIGKFCDKYCPPCILSRKRAKWLQPVVKFIYYLLCSRISWLPCRSREKQTGKKPWE